MKWEHLTIEKRKIITNMLSHGAKLCEIGEILNMDPTSISKEIKRNRVISKQGKTNKICKKLDRYPYICNHCKLKYTTCVFTQYKYEATKADELANHKLVYSRTGLNIDEQEFNKIDELIKEGLERKESIYHIVNSNDEISVSVPTIYRWINEKKLSTKKIDLPYAVKYKKRKQNKKYDYSNNKIDRSNRTFLDYLEHRRAFPGEYTVQMDFLGSIISDSKSILTLTIPELHIPIIKIFKNPNQETIVNFFNRVEEAIGLNNFRKVFPSILTDRDPCFTDYEGIEFSHITGEKRTSIFYCDPYVSTQKANVENMNKQLRKFFLKGQSIEHLSEDDIKHINVIILDQKIPSLGGFTPREAFIKVYGKGIIEKLINL